MQNPSLKSPKTYKKDQTDLKIKTNNSNQNINSQSALSDPKKPHPSLPIPKGETPYALAKLAEYKERDLTKAEYYYKLAIKKGERVFSAIKDLASLLHQRGKTKQALSFLNSHKNLFRSDTERFENLYKTLEKQLTTSSNSQNKCLKISNLSKNDSEIQVKHIFENPIRIQSFEFGCEELRKEINYYCILKFNSHSSARKTLEGFHLWEKYRVEWVNFEGKVVSDAHYYKQKMEDYRKDHPTFDYQIFDRDPHGYIFCLPLDSSPLVTKQTSEQEVTLQELLGSQLFSTIFNEIECC